MDIALNILEITACLFLVGVSGIACWKAIEHILISQLERRWQKELWIAHQDISGQTDADLQKRRELRREIRDTTGIISRRDGAGSRILAVAFLLSLQIGLVAWIASRDAASKATPAFWVLCVFLFACLFSTIILCVRRDDH